ncbi:hypothetical protein ACHAWF_007769 [Thalassiosira exigua]
MKMKAPPLLLGAAAAALSSLDAALATDGVGGGGGLRPLGARAAAGSYYEYDPRGPPSRPERLAPESELVEEMRRLHAALHAVQALLESAELPADDEVMSKAAKLVRRVRSLVYATNDELGRPGSPRREEIVHRMTRRRDEKNEQELLRRRQVRIDRRKKMRRAGKLGMPGGEGELLVRVGEIAGRELEAEAEAAFEAEERGFHDERALVGDGMLPEGDAFPEDDLARRLYQEAITFPECGEHLLDECLQIISQQLAELQIDATTVVREKRNEDQEGYYKVVIVTDLTATLVKGKHGDGMVDYPFLWDDAVEGFAKTLNANGQWDCHNKSPEECCSIVLASCPNPDTKGNTLQCHIFVPFGGVGNRKRDDRVFVNLSPDGRVHEAPVLA